MSVVIVVSVSEGLVLAADSAATLTARRLNPDGVIGQEEVLQTFYNAKKLFQLGTDLPIGVLTWGHAYIGSRTIESLVREWEYDSGWQSLQSFKDANHDKQYSVQNCAKDLKKHIFTAHQKEFGKLPREQQPGIGLVVAGYSEEGFFPEIWRFIVPFDDDVINHRPDIHGQPNFGASWFGLTEPIVRLHFGRDDQLIQVLSEKFAIPPAELLETLRPLEYQVPFGQMPLQDAIEYANYMVNVVIGRFRFVIGPEFCGGKIDIAAITQREFNWISKKTWKLE